MPAVTMRLEMTKQDMRNGRKTGWPVSEMSIGEEPMEAVASYQGAT